MTATEAKFGSRCTKGKQITTNQDTKISTTFVDD